MGFSAIWHSLTWRSTASSEAAISCGSGIGDVVVNAAPRHRAMIVQQKTGEPVQFELTEQTWESLVAWLTHRSGSLDLVQAGTLRLWAQSPTFSSPRRLSKSGHASRRGICGSGVLLTSGRFSSRTN